MTSYPSSPEATYAQEEAIDEAVFGATFSLSESDEDMPPESSLGHVPDEALVVILSMIANVRGIACLSRVCRTCSIVLKNELVWAHHVVNVAPWMLPAFAPHLDKWLPAWRLVSKVIVPRSHQLLAEMKRQAPDLPVELAWRFDKELKGDGVEIVGHGQSVKRVDGAEEELVVLGDSPLPRTDDDPYLEVILDERIEDLSQDNLNDFGIGVTAQPPSDIGELGAVAGEVPLSWVVDFTRSSVVLSVNNMEAAKGYGANATDLFTGARVGLSVTKDGCLELFINGKLRERLAPPENERVPSGVELFPVLDLYGCTSQLSRSDARRPNADTGY
jgi:hypothetical protein